MFVYLTHQEKKDMKAIAYASRYYPYKSIYPAWQFTIIVTCTDMQQVVGNFEHICMVVSSDIPMTEPVASIGNDYNIVELS